MPGFSLMQVKKIFTVGEKAHFFSKSPETSFKVQAVQKDLLGGSRIMTQWSNQFPSISVRGAGTSEVLC